MHLPPRTFDFTTWWGACPERKSKDRFFARLASEIFLSSLQSEFFSTLLVQGAWIGVYDSTTLGSIAKQRLDVSVSGNG